MCKDALNREEFCGTYARVEHLPSEGEAKRDDKNYSFVAAWEYQQEGAKLHEEHLHFKFIKAQLGTTNDLYIAYLATKERKYSRRICDL